MYAGSHILLALTQFALCKLKMTRICDKYAKEYKIVFNSNTSKLIVFGMNC